MSDQWLSVGDPEGFLKDCSPELKDAGTFLITWAHEIYLPRPWGMRYTSGLREALEQAELFAHGRKQDPKTGRWRIVDRSRVVTYCDGYRKRSNHQDQDGDLLADALDFVLTYHGRAMWWPRHDDRSPDAEMVRQMYIGIAGKIRELDLETGADWTRPFDIYHMQRKRKVRGK